MKKRIIALVVALVFVFAAVPAVSADIDDMTGKVVIIHTNDVHSRVDENLGYTAVAALKHEYELAGAEVVVIDAGDTFHGLPIANLAEGETIVEIMDAVGYDYHTPGNHDFNYGYEQLVGLDGIAGFHMLSANLAYESGDTVLDASDTFVIDGVTYGIFGLSTPSTTYMTHPDNVAGLVFEDCIETAAAEVAALQAAGCDYIIALGHIGLDSNAGVTSDEICEAVDGIDLFIDGHSHSVLENGLEVNDALIVSTGEYLESIGVVVIDPAADTIEASLVGAEYTGTDSAVDALIAEIRTELDEVLQVVVGYTDVLLDGEREHVRTRETNLGNLSADAIRLVANADVAVTNGGGIRASIEIGEITLGDIISVFPFGNYVVAKEVTGQDIHDALEHAVRVYPETNGGFLQVSGMTFTFYTNRDAGNRVDPENILIGGEPIDLSATYVLATNDFLAAGGDGFTTLNGVTVNEYPSLDEVLIDFISALDTFEAYADIEGRILTAEAENPDPPKTGAISLSIAAIAAMAGGAAIVIFRKK
ncbi:MAG: bifunctional UDP-sugar hydrolase/5'-nucleotidase [Clostridia bacterium]|nr:bifunctional UDP-sugar hydrolase/5'-nucleotidase [Clostridia bacterium]